MSEMKPRTIEEIAKDILYWLHDYEPGYSQFVSVTTAEVAALAMQHVTICPRCDWEAWGNENCSLCRICREASEVADA